MNKLLKPKSIKSYLDLLPKIPMVMRITVVLLFCILFQSHAEKLYSQSAKISLNLQNTTVEEILNMIEENSEYSFLYNSKLVNVDRKASVNANKKTIRAVLSELFDNSDVQYKVEDKQIVLSNKKLNIANDQQIKKVTGVVKDNMGLSIIGANILVKGTSNGTTTDFNGNFSLDVAENNILLVSYIGYISTELKVNNNSIYEIILKEDTQALDEVIVIGFGSVKKSNLTSSVSKMSEKALSDRPISTISEAFQGQLAGVRSQAVSGLPGAEYTIQIRGVNTINGNSSPLYIIDGVPRDNMSDLNANDISTIQVLKDASATSIYGSRGANGVVLIETKQGTGKPTLTFDAYYGVQTAAKKLDMMDSNEWIALNMYQRNLAHLMDGGSMNDPASARASMNRIPEEWYSNTVNTDWQDAIMQTAPIQSYNVSASTKNDMGSIYFSAGYMDQDGLVNETYYEKMNIRLNASMNINSKLRVGVNLSASSSTRDTKDAENKEGAIHKSLMMSPIVGLDENTQEWGFAQDVGNSSSYENPVESLKYKKNETTYLRLNTAIWAEYDILKELKFKTQYSYNYDGQTYESFTPSNVTVSNITSGSSNASTIGNWTIQNTLSFDKMFNELNHFNLLLGQSAESRSFYKISASATGWPYDNIETLNVATTPITASTNRNLYRNASFFGRANYEFDNKYLLTASLRYDGSSRFGTNTKWGAFPSFSAGWKVNEELFMDQADWISLLKVRASWGLAGNDRIGDYAYMSLMNIDKTTWGNETISGIAPKNIANPDLQWESTRSLNLGFDFSSFNNRVQLNFDYYINTTDNLLFKIATPYTTGFSSYLANIGEIKNQGWELDLTTSNIVGKFNWTSSLNLSHNKNEVMDMGGIDQIISSNYDARFITRVGGSISEFYGYEADGILTNNCFDTNGKALVPIAKGQIEGNVRYVDNNNDGVITAEDQVPSGSNLPDLTYGFTNNFSWNNFDLSILLQGQFGGDIMFLGQRQYDYGSKVSAGVNQMSRWLNCYKDEKYAEAIPYDFINKHGIDMSWDGETPVSDEMYGYQNRNDSRRIYDATFLRVKNITFGYTCSKQILSKTPFRGLKGYFSIDNAFTFDDYRGYNPEANAHGNSTTQQGVDYSAYPLSRRFTFGISVIF